MDRLTKSAHFIAYNMTYLVERMSFIYLQQVVRLHGVPVSIVLYCDARFTSRFWESLQGVIGTSLKKSITFHPQTDGQTKCTNQVMEDMLRACALDFESSWQTL